MRRSFLWACLALALVPAAAEGRWPAGAALSVLAADGPRQVSPSGAGGDIRLAAASAGPADLSPAQDRPLAPRAAPRPVPRHSASSTAPVQRAIGASDVKHKLLSELQRAAEAGIVTFEDTRQTDGLPKDSTITPEVGAARPLREDKEAPGLDGPPVAGAVLGSSQAKPAPQATAESLPASIVSGTEAGISGRDWSRCMPDAMLALDAATVPADLAELLAAHRRTVLGEFDRADDSAVLSLARTYIAAGLGIEASAVLGQYDPAGPAAEAVGAMATILAGMPQADAAALPAPACSGLDALWRAYGLARAREALAAVEHFRRSGEAIGSLPALLRGEMALAIGEAALAAGRADLARWLGELARRSLPTDPVALRRIDLLQARLSISKGSEDGVLEQVAGLPGLSGFTGDLDPLALAGVSRAKDASRLENARAGEGIIQLLGAEALRNRAGPEGARAFLAEASLRAESDGLSAAADLLRHGFRRGLVSRPEAAEALLRLSRNAADGPGGASELALAYSARPEAFEFALHLPAFRRRLAFSMISAGVPRQASGVLHEEDYLHPDVIAGLTQSISRLEDREAANWLRDEVGPERLPRKLGALSSTGTDGSDLVSGHDPFAALSPGEAPTANATATKKSEVFVADVMAGEAGHPPHNGDRARSAEMRKFRQFLDDLSDDVVNLRRILSDG